MSSNGITKNGASVNDTKQLIVGYNKTLDLIILYYFLFKKKLKILEWCTIKS